jgi:predicted GNAT superfamily acetyltransferase
MQVSKVNIDDLSTIRVINDGAIPAVNSVSDEEFIWFHKNSIYFKKVIVNEILAGFLLVLPMNIPYKSLNYSWFSERYNIKPLNMISENFHQKMAYKNVGTQLTENNTKQVSLMVKEIND